MDEIYSTAHVVVTPARNEGQNLSDLVSSMASQTIVPRRWLIVNDNSSDETNEIIIEAESSHDWISHIDVNNGSKRKRGRQISALFNLGLSSIDCDWQFCSKIDADMILPTDYFERIFAEFYSEKSLGIAGGVCYLISNGKEITERTFGNHTRGGLKTYRRECLESIGGIKEVDGWDGIDRIMAQMENWDCRALPSLRVTHQRSTGSSYGLLRSCFENGSFAYSMSYYPPYMLLRCLHMVTKWPYLFGGFSMFLGYLSAFLCRRLLSVDPLVSHQIRSEQKKRIRNWRKLFSEVFYPNSGD